MIVGVYRDRSGLALAENFEILTAAWRVHTTSAELFRQSSRAADAEAHRAEAESIICSLADSFAAGDPLRDSLLEAPRPSEILRGR
jgi:hypothetical protein